jgi:hypothetical protein
MRVAQRLLVDSSMTSHHHIDLTVLASVVGGAACPKYASSADELARRSHMSKAQRAAADKAWQRTVASLSTERLEAVRKQAALNANTGACKVAEPLLKLDLDDMRL